MSVCVGTKSDRLLACFKFALTFLIGFCAAVAITSFNFRAIFGQNVRTYNAKSSCRAFLADGHYELKDNDWRPNRCRMFHYSKHSVPACMIRADVETKRRSYFLFVGDSRTREQYQLFVEAAATRPYSVSRLKGPAIYSDQLFDAEYVPDPYLDLFPQIPRNRTPSFVVFGATAWFMKRGQFDQQAGLQRFIGDMKKVAGRVKAIANVTTFIWMSPASYLQPYVYKYDCSGLPRNGTRPRLMNTTGCLEKHRFFINAMARRYNEAAANIFSNVSRSTYIWSAARGIVHSFIFDQTDTTHLMQLLIDTPPSPALHLRAQMLLNFHCNRFRDTDAGNDGVEMCCARNDQ